MFAFVVTLILIAFFISNIHLRDRISKIEKTLDYIQKNNHYVEQTENLNLQPTKNPPPPNLYEPEHNTTTPPEPVIKQGSLSPTREVQISKPSPLITWFKEQTLIKLGALFFFLGIAWFLGYAIQEGWIDPSVRIFAVILIGISMYVLGHWRSHISKTQHLTFTALGTAIIFTSVASGQFTLELLPPFIALGLLILSILYTLWTSFRTNSEWLAVISAISALIAPLLVNSPTTSHQSLLLYLLIASVTLISVVTFTKFRGVSLVLIIGVGIYLMSIYESGSINELSLWIYTIIFSALFFMATSYSMLRTQDVKIIDISSLAIITLWYLLLANGLAFSPGIATLIASFALATVGYMAQINRANPNVITVFAVFSTIALLFGTSFLFSGITLTLIFALEITALITLVCYLNLSDRIILTTSFLYTLPILLSIEHFTSNKWEYGIIHLPAVTVVIVLLSLLWGTHTILNQYKKSGSQPNLTLGGILLLISYIYSFGLSATFGETIDNLLPSADGVSFYLLLFASTFSLIVYTIVQKLPQGWSTTGFFTIGIPLLMSFNSLEISYWQTNGILHINAFGVISSLLFLILLACFSLINYKYTNLIYYRTVAMFLISITIFYLLFVIQAFWHAIFPHTPILTHVVIYTNYAVLVYVLLLIAIKQNLSNLTITIVKSLGILPLLMSLPSFYADEWNSNILHPDAAGLYALTTLTFIIGISLLQYSKENSTLTQITYLYKIVFTIGTLLSIGLIWVMSNSLTPTQAGGVTISLFIYTVSGLILYLLGRSRKEDNLRWMGISLIALVTIRLLLVDIWVMEVFWRIITFIGIGTLFMTAALLEKQSKDD